MIRVSCAECGQAFETGEEFAGTPEFCPICGALNDIPKPQDLEGGEPVADEIPAEAAPSVHRSPRASRGVPAPLWWSLIVGSIAVFIIACIVLFSDDWESRHLDALNNAANRGDVLMVDGDFAGAASQYRFVLDTVGGRQIESIYIRQLVDHARSGEQRAMAMAKSRSQQPKAAPAIAATQPDIYAAMRRFQRDSEAFPIFVRNHPVVFQDRNGLWRRRQFVVWDVSYQQQPQSDGQRISLQYSCAARVTGPHDNRRDAESDSLFITDESPRTVRCQTVFELAGDRWIIASHDVEAGLPTDELFELERLAFQPQG